MESDYRKLLETSCLACVIDVVGSEDVVNEIDPSERVYGWVNVGLISNDMPIFHRSWRGRFRRAWMAMCARDWPFLEFYTPAEIDAFTKALGEAGAVAFPPDARD